MIACRFGTLSDGTCVWNLGFQGAEEKLGGSVPAGTGLSMQQNPCRPLNLTTASPAMVEASQCITTLRRRDDEQHTTAERRGTL